MHRSIRELRLDLLQRLGQGSHLILHGPKGSGKTTLVKQLHERFRRAHVPCAIAPSTTCLDDITAALERAYPGVQTQTVSRRTARSRLWMAADHHGGVLLLDHVDEVSTAMLGFLRHLRGGVAGALFVVDVDVERDRERMRAKHLAALSVRMPPMATARLRALLRAHCAESGIRLELHVESALLRAARGRPGWIVQCASLMGEPRYRHEGCWLPTLLCTDTEIALRFPGLKRPGAAAEGEDGKAPLG